MECSFLFCEVWIQHLSVLFVSIFPVQNLKLLCTNPEAWKTSAQKLHLPGWFFVQNSQTTSPQKIRISFREKNILEKEVQSTHCKKKRTSPIKQKILHLTLALKKKKTTKRFHQWKKSHKIDYKWLKKVGDIRYCKRCSKFPKLHHRKHELVHGGEGNKDGLKEEMFTRHSNYHKKITHNECQQYYDRIISSYGTKVSSVYPDVTTSTTQISWPA